MPAYAATLTGRSSTLVLSNLRTRLWEMIMSRYYHLLGSFLHWSFGFLKNDFFNLFLERGKGTEKEKERNINVREKHQSVATCTPPTWDMACNTVLCPNWESNQWPFGLWKDAHPTELHQSGLIIQLFWDWLTLIIFINDRYINKTSNLRICLESRSQLLIAKSKY